VHRAGVRIAAWTVAGVGLVLAFLALLAVLAVRIRRPRRLRAQPPRSEQLAEPQ
jgi:Na+-transporting methylmalonyl-CoA/oxaloacetate decarboxylase gamma subunit